MSKSNVEILLGEWGRWKRRENRNPLSYPRQSAFVSMRVDGMRRAEPDAFLVDDALMKLDRLINSLYSEAMAAVTAHYVWSGRSPEKIARLKTNQAAYYASLNFARKQLEHWMSDESAQP